MPEQRHRLTAAVGVGHRAFGVVERPRLVTELRERLRQEVVRGGKVGIEIKHRLRRLDGAVVATCVQQHAAERDAQHG